MRTGTTGQDGVRADDVRDDTLIGAALARAASVRIEDYAIVGDTQTIALVGIDGSIDWLCLPRFDSGACFAALLGDASHGRWQIAPAGGVRRTRRRYRGDTLVLETEMETADGVVRVVDGMPIRGKYPDVVRVVEGVSGSVPMRSELVVRFDYGSIVPWVRKMDGRLHAIAGPDALVLTTPVRTHGERFTTVAQFTVHAGERVPFVLTWHPSYEAAPESAEPFSALDETEAWWREWASRHEDAGAYRDATLRSLITLKALTYAPSGGIVAAATTSLPEAIGGSRNWDYRFCWLRDATLTLYALLGAGFREEAIAWRDWLLRTVAGDPGKLQIMYGVIGDRRLDEREIDWLPGYEGSRPVRIGNAAWSQFQLDVYGEVLDTFHQARRMGVGAEAESWALQLAICESLERDWRRPDEGFWEIRDSKRHFTYSKVMAWVALDRAIKAVERHSVEGPIDRWRAVRDEIHRDVCSRGYDAELGCFTQSYGSKSLDATLLRIPTVGFLPIGDPRVKRTISAIERSLLRDGFVARYHTQEGRNVDGVAGKEGTFLACSFWLVDAYVLSGRREEAVRLFERLLAVRNDVGLLSEEYDVSRRRLVGNYPQAFSHVALVNSARNLSRAGGPAHHRTST